MHTAAPCTHVAPPPLTVAVLGGIFTVFGLLDGLVFHTTEMFSKKTI